MKQVDGGYNETEMVDAYQDKDLLRISADLRQAETIWLEEWNRQGKQDEGTCTGGKGFRVWYLGPRKRIHTLLTVVKAPPVQGNLSAERSHAPALEYLESVGVEASYYDGWMD